jgi:hypothetical protein
MDKNAFIKRNKLIKESLFLNLIACFLIIFMIPAYSWFNELLEIIILCWFLFRYTKSRKSITHHFEFNLNKYFHKKELSLFEISAGTIIGQFFILILIFSFRLHTPAMWQKYLIMGLIILLLWFIANIFEGEYKRNKKNIDIENKV